MLMFTKIGQASYKRIEIEVEIACPSKAKRRQKVEVFDLDAENKKDIYPYLNRVKVDKANKDNAQTET